MRENIFLMSLLAVVVCIFCAGNISKADKITDEDAVEISDAKWYKHHYDCKFTVTTADGVQEVDLSEQTQYFNNVPDSANQVSCEKGEQVTCNDVFNQYTNSKD